MDQAAAHSHASGHGSGHEAAHAEGQQHPIKLYLVVWVLLFVLGGYWFGNLELVRKNFTLVILAIIILSILPAVWEVWKARRENTRREKSSQA